MTPPDDNDPTGPQVSRPARLAIDGLVLLVSLIAVFSVAVVLYVSQAVNAANPDGPVQPVACVESVRVTAFVDGNGDGSHDDDEVGLAGVPVMIENTTEHSTTDDSGLATLVFDVDCADRDNLAYWVLVETPAGYIPTGRTRANKFGPFQFGFLPAGQ